MTNDNEILARPHPHMKSETSFLLTMALSICSISYYEVIMTIYSTGQKY